MKNYMIRSIAGIIVGAIYLLIWLGSIALVVLVVVKALQALGVLQ